MKIAVIGVGGTGGAAARFLAAEGHSVVGLEQFRIGHELGSSHGESRIIRYTYPDSLYTSLMADAYPLWRALETESGRELYVRSGGLFFGPDGHPDVTATAGALDDGGIPYELLAAEEANCRFPALRLLPGESAVYQQDSGFLRAGEAVRANAELARKHGATLREETPVLGLRPVPNGVLVRTATDEAFFDRAIVSAGAWVGTLLRDLALPLKVTRQEIAYLAIGMDPEAFEPGRLPVWIDAGTGWYGFPSDGRIAGVKLAHHAHGEPQDPDQARPDVSDDGLARLIAVARKRLPGLAAEVVHQRTCLYTNTPNEDFILDHLPDSEHVWVVSGCSGHGFKFTVLLGRIAADLATGRGYPRDLSRFRLDRFVGRTGGPETDRTSG
jgi:sarcosine oxidase